MATDDKQNLQAALGRLRESVLFYLRLDFALFAGFIALAAAFKFTLEGMFQFAPGIMAMV